MTIEDIDFKLEQVNDSSYAWDLYLLKTVKPKTGMARQELVLDSYGLPLDAAIRKIVSFRISQKHDVLDLPTYIRLYQKAVDEVTSMTRGMIIDKDIDDSNV